MILVDGYLPPLCPLSFRHWRLFQPCLRLHRVHLVRHVHRVFRRVGLSPRCRRFDPSCQLALQSVKLITIGILFFFFLCMRFKGFHSF